MMKKKKTTIGNPSAMNRIENRESKMGFGGNEREGCGVFSLLHYSIIILLLPWSE